MQKKSPLTDPKIVFLLALICAILWGSAFPVLRTSFPLLKIGKTDIYSKSLFAGIRFFIAALMLFAFAWGKQTSAKISHSQLKQLLILGILQTTLQYFLFYTGLAHTNGVKGSILAPGSGPLFVIIIAHFIYQDDKLSIKKWLGLLLGLTGIILINLKKGSFDFTFQISGEGFLLATGFVSAIGTFKAKKLAININPIIIAAWQMFLGSIFLIIIGITNGYHLHFTKTTIILLIYSSFLSATAFVIWYSLLKYNKAGKIAVYKFLIPICGSLLSLIFMPDENFSYIMLIALLAVTIGIFIVNKQSTQMTKKI